MTTLSSNYTRVMSPHKTPIVDFPLANDQGLSIISATETGVNLSVVPWTILDALHRVFISDCRRIMSGG